MITEKTIDMLTKDSVSILTKKFIEDEGEKLQVGKNHRCAYVNSKSGRERILTNEPEEVSSTVIQYWGDTPTVEEIEYPTSSEEELIDTEES